MSIEILRDEDGNVIQLTVDAEKIECYDNNYFYVPKGLLRGHRLDEIPVGVSLQICDSHDDDTIFFSTIPFAIENTSSSTAVVSMEDSGRRKYWDGEIGFRAYMEIKKSVIEERHKEAGDVALVSYEDDGDYIFLTYSFEDDAEYFDEVISHAEQLILEIDGAAELTIGIPWKPADHAKDERDFTLSTVIPLLRKLGFLNVKYNHRNREFGKDIVFARRTEFDDLERWGAQAKLGDISGAANSDMDMIIAQIDDAFKLPYYDVYSKRKETISKLIIVISGKFTDNAIEKICEKIDSHAARNNVVFLDGDRISSIAERFRRL